MQSEAVKNAIRYFKDEKYRESIDGVGLPWFHYDEHFEVLIEAAQSPASAVEVTDEIAGIVQKMTELTEAEVWDGDWSEDCQDFWNDGDAKKLVDWLKVIAPLKSPEGV